jgi:hypothetical protein
MPDDLNVRADFESAEHNPAGLSDQMLCQTDFRVNFVLWGIDL